jgi:hypothetical protein
MTTVNIAITATEQDFSTFADELGYQDVVSKTPEELALLVEPISIQDRLKPNPQSKTDFLLEYFKRITTTELARVKIANIQRQVDVAKEAEKEAMRVAISNVVTVTVA